MLLRVRRFFDIRPGEALPILLTFLYIAAVMASLLLAKSIRSGLFLKQYSPYDLGYVYAAVPIVLSLFVPVYTRIATRFGQRSVTVGTLLFFSANVVAFWYAFRFHPTPLLAGVFYVWVNCFAVIAPVQAWSFTHSLFDTRQAKRLFGVIGSGASLGAIVGGLMARLLVIPVGGAVNLLLVLAALIGAASGIVTVANARVRRKGLARRGRSIARPFAETMTEIARSPYLRLIASMVFLVAIVTLWTGFQLNLEAVRRFGRDDVALTQFNGTFNVALGAVSFIAQLVLTGPVLRRFGVALAILLLPAALGAGSAAIVLLPGFWPVVATNAFDQSLRFSVDKTTYELLYLPIAPASRVRVKNAIDIFVNRIGDATGAVLLLLVTDGFYGVHGLGFGLRGTSAINLGLLGVWFAVAWRLRREYVGTIRDSIHRHRLDAERASQNMLDRSVSDAIVAKLAGTDTADVLYALTVMEQQRAGALRGPLRELLHHADPEVRRRALALLAAEGDRAISAVAGDLLRDPDIGVRTEALVYLAREMGVDPLALIEELGDFSDFSIRAGMAAFLASPGASRNLDAARAILEQMVRSEGPEGVRDRAEAARVLALVTEGFGDLVTELLRDSDASVLRVAIEAARTTVPPEAPDALVDLLARRDVGDEAAAALARYGRSVLPLLKARLLDGSTPAEVRREIPQVLAEMGTADAGQVLVDALLEGDATVRYRVIASLNKLHRLHPRQALDRELITLLLEAEISGHYRSYQVMGSLRSTIHDDDAIMAALRGSMEHELERIFRLMSLLFPKVDLQDAYVGLQSTNPTIRANALEFLDNVLSPTLRRALVPLLDAQIGLDERIAMADHIVGAPLRDVEQGMATLLADPALRGVAQQALHRIKGEPETPADAQEPTPPQLRMGVG